MIATGEDLFFMAACFTLVLTYLFCGAIRWCNLWRPFNEDTDQLFPARRIMTINYLAAGLLIPCLFHPYSPDAWLCARSFFLLHIPTFSILTFQSFFFGHYKKNKRQILLIGAIPIGLLLLLSGFACAGGNHLAGQQKMILSDRPPPIVIRIRLRRRKSSCRTTKNDTFTCRNHLRIAGNLLVPDHFPAWK